MKIYTGYTTPVKMLIVWYYHNNGNSTSYYITVVNVTTTNFIVFVLIMVTEIKTQGVLLYSHLAFISISKKNTLKL